MCATASNPATPTGDAHPMRYPFPMLPVRGWILIFPNRGFLSRERYCEAATRGRGTPWHRRQHRRHCADAAWGVCA